jgi:hypothetical protein
VEPSDPNNYAIAYNPGSLTVNQLPVTLTGSRAYDGTATADSGILTVANVVSGDILILAGSVTLASKDVGIENITSFSGLTIGSPNLRNGNYTLTGANGSVTITKGTATVALGNLTQTYDGTPKSPSATTTPAGLNVVSPTDADPAHRSTRAVIRWWARSTMPTTTARPVAR